MKIHFYIQFLLIFSVGQVLAVHQQDNISFTQSQNITQNTTNNTTNNGSAFTSILDVIYDDANPSILTSLDIHIPAHIPAINNTFPIVFFIHGGGWSAGDKAGIAHINKRDFFIDHGFIFISTNYRLAPDVTFPVYPQDVARAFVNIVDTATDFNGNINEIFILGHSAGAHLGALIALDQSYLSGFGSYAEFIQGVILLDGAGYDIPYIIDYNIQNDNQPRLNIYYTTFGKSDNLWEIASPISHVNSIQIPPFQLFYVDTHTQSILTSTRLYQEFIDNNHPAQRISVSDSSHALINRNFGANGDDVAPVALDFINSIRETIFSNGFDD